MQILDEPRFAINFVRLERHSHRHANEVMYPVGAAGVVVYSPAMREIFLSRLVYQTFNGYVLSQFKKLATDLRLRGAPKWKHVMHLLRLLQSGITVLREGYVPVRIADGQSERFLAIRRGEVVWEEVEAWRKALHAEFDAAYQTTRLPERPDYERANAFLIRARREAINS